MRRSYSEYTFNCQLAFNSIGVLVGTEQEGKQRERDTGDNEEEGGGLAGAVDDTSSFGDLEADRVDLSDEEDNDDGVVALISDAGLAVTNKFEAHDLADDDDASENGAVEVAVRKFRVQPFLFLISLQTVRDSQASLGDRLLVVNDGNLDEDEDSDASISEDGIVLQNSEAQEMLKRKKPWLAEVSCIVWYGPIPGSRLHAELLYTKLQDKVHKKSFIFDCLLKEALRIERPPLLTSVPAQLEEQNPKCNLPPAYGAREIARRKIAMGTSTGMVVYDWYRGINSSPTRTEHPSHPLRFFPIPYGRPEDAIYQGPCYPDNAYEPLLAFDSHFESGNLLRALRVTPFTYDLFLRPGELEAERNEGMGSKMSATERTC